MLLSNVCLFILRLLKLIGLYFIHRLLQAYKKSKRHPVCSVHTEGRIAQRRSKGENVVFTPPLLTNVNTLDINRLGLVCCILMECFDISVRRYGKTSKKSNLFRFFFSKCKYLTDSSHRGTISTPHLQVFSEGYFFISPSTAQR